MKAKSKLIKINIKEDIIKDLKESENYLYELEIFFNGLTRGHNIASQFRDPILLSMQTKLESVKRRLTKIRTQLDD